MELTPRTSPVEKKRSRRLPLIIFVTLFVLVGGFLLVQALGSAATFYRNVDEAVAQKDSLGTKRFRLQGTVVPGTIARTGDGVTFEVAYNGVGLNVNHVGDPPEMFKDGEAVLLEGRLTDQGGYNSDLMIIKHSEVYEEKQQERLVDADVNGKVPVTTVGG